jgi:acetyl esterase/lipase
MGKGRNEGQCFCRASANCQFSPYLALLYPVVGYQSGPGNRVEEMVYGHKDGLALAMLQLSPAGKPNGKAIIRVVAGSWYSNYDMAENYIMGSYDYLQKGFKVFHVMVGTQPRYNMTEQVADVKRAVRYIRYNAPNLGIEGGSAGGHLSLCVALADEQVNEKSADPVDGVSSRVQAVAVLFPPTDLLNWGGTGLNFVNAKPLLELNKVWGSVDFKTLQESTMTYVPVTDTAARNKIGREVSPLYAVSADDPPIFFMHGDADPTVPIQQSLILGDRLKDAGIQHRFILKPGGKHNANDMLPEWQEAVDWFEKWLK